MDTRPLPEGWEERFDETYWLWMRYDPPKKSYRHPLGDIMVSGHRASTVNESGLPLSPLSFNSTVNNDDVIRPIDHPESTHDAPAYSEFSEVLEDTEQHEYTGNQDYWEGFTDSSGSSELSAPPPSVDDFYAASVRQQSFITTAATSIPPLLPQTPVSATSLSTPRLGDTILPPLVRLAVSGPRAPRGSKPRASSLTNASGSTKDIPTFAVKYRPSVLDSLGPNSNSNSSTHPSTLSIPGLYTQVQYHGPQSQIVNMRSLQSQPQPDPPPPIMWRQGLQGQFQNQTHPQAQSQVPTQTQPSGGNNITHARLSAPSQPVALGTMPGPGQPGYAGFLHSRTPSAGPFENQGPMLMSSSVQVQSQASVPENPQQQLMAPPPPPLPNQQRIPQGVRKGGMPLRSSPPPGGIIPAPYNSPMPSFGNRSSPQQRPRSGIPPHSSPPPGGFAPAPYNMTPKQASGSPSSQQGNQQTYPPTARHNVPPQSNPPLGGCASTAYTVSQAQAVPSGHSSLQQQPQQTSQQFGMPPQLNSQPSFPSREYVPVSYHASQAQAAQQPSQVLETVQQQPQRPAQQVVTPPQSSPHPGVYIPVSYTASQTQVEPAKPPPGGYNPVSYNQSQVQPGLSQQQQPQVQQAGVQQNSQGQQQQVHFPPTKLQGMSTSNPSQNLTEVPLNGSQTMSGPDQQSMDAGGSSRSSLAPGGYVPVSYYPPQTSAPPNAHSPSYSSQSPSVYSTPLSSSPHVASVNGPALVQPTTIQPQSQLIQASARTQIQSQAEQSVLGPTSYSVTPTLTTQVQSNPSHPVSAAAQRQGPFMSYVGSPQGSPALPPRRLQKPKPQTHAHVTKYTKQHQNQSHQSHSPPPSHQHQPHPHLPPQDPPPLHGNYQPYLQPIQYVSSLNGSSVPSHPSSTIYTSPSSYVQTLPTMSMSSGGMTHIQPPPQQPLTFSTYNAYTPVNYGPAGVSQNVPVQIPQQNMQYCTPQNVQEAVSQLQPPQQAMNQQSLPQQSASIPAYGFHVPVNYGPTAVSQNIPTQTPQQNTQYLAPQYAQVAAAAPQPSQQATNQQQTPNQGNQGNPSQTQSNGQRIFTLSNITNAINLGVSAINLFETVENAVNPGSYPASSNSGGGTNVTLNINAGGNQGSSQNSGSNDSGGSRLSDTTDLVNSLSSAVTAFSSLNIGGNNNSSNSNANLGAANLGSNDTAASFGFNNLNNFDTFNNSGFNNAGDFGFGNSVNYGGGGF